MRGLGPLGDNKDFHRDSFCCFLIKNKTAVIGFPIIEFAVTSNQALQRTFIMTGILTFAAYERTSSKTLQRTIIVAVIPAQLSIFIMV